MSNNSFNENVFGKLLNDDYVNPSLLVKLIDDFCVKLPTIEDLFLRFYIALQYDIISLETYKCGKCPFDDSIAQFNKNILAFNFDFSNTDIMKLTRNEFRCTLDFDYVNYENRLNLNLRHILQQNSLYDYCIKYYQYLNKLVYHVLSYHDSFIILTTYLTKIPFETQKQIIVLKQAIDLKPVTDLKRHNTCKSVHRIGSRESYYSTEELIGALKFSLFYFKTVIDFCHFTYIMDKIKYKQVEKQVYNREIEDFEHLVIHSKKMNSNTHHYDTPFTTAASAGILELILIFIKYKADIDQKDGYGKTALMYAVKNAHLNCVLKLIENGADVNIQDSGGKTALIYAAEYGNIECLLALVENGANINIQSQYGRTALTYAAAEGYADCLFALIENGANIDDNYDFGDNAIIYALEHENISCIKILLENGTNIYSTDNFKVNPIIPTIINNQIDYFKLLIEDNMNVLNFRTKSNKTLLMYAAMCGRSDHISLLLIKYRGNIDYQDKYGWTALMYAAKQADIDCLLKLIENGAKLDVQNYESMTALMVAAKEGHFYCLLKLIENGAKLDFKNAFGYTALTLAEKYGHSSCINILNKITQAKTQNHTDKK